MYEYYKQLKLPSYAPPGIAFYYAWMILYFLMLVSFIILLFLPRLYFILQACGICTAGLCEFFMALRIFQMEKSWISCVISFVLFVLVLFMTLIFFKLMPLLGWLQIPYVLWLVFASILNFDVYRLNKDD